MSYPGVDPGDVKQMNPVGTQDASSGEPIPFSEKPDPTGKFDKVLEPKPDFEAEVKKAIDEMFSVTDAWAPKQIVKFKVDLPSGQTVLLRHLDAMDLIEHDLIEELDFFLRRLFPKDIDPSGNPVEHDENDETLFSALRDPQKRRRFMEMTGRLLEISAVRPKVIHDGVAVIDGKVVFGYQMTTAQQLEHFKKPIPKITDPKNESYSGPVDFADRLHVFQELNKPLKVIEPFRESSIMLQDMAGSEGYGGEAE